MDVTAGLAFAAARSKGTLVTIGGDGRPQVSNVLYVLDGDVASMSLTDDRVKTRNLRADPRACLHVTDESFWQYVVLDGVVDLSPVAMAPDDPTVERLVAYYRALSGEHPDWDEYRAAMVADRRLVASLAVMSAYGQAQRVDLGRGPAAYRLRVPWVRATTCPTDPALVAQGIEQRFPKPCAGSSILPEGTTRKPLRRQRNCPSARVIAREMPTHPLPPAGRPGASTPP